MLSRKVRIKRILISTLVTALVGVSFYYAAADSVTVFNDSRRRVVSGSIDIAGHTFPVGTIQPGGSTSFRYWPINQDDCRISLTFANGIRQTASNGLVDARMFSDSLRVVVSPSHMRFIAGW